MQIANNQDSMMRWVAGLALTALFLYAGTPLTAGPYDFPPIYSSN